MAGLVPKAWLDEQLRGRPEGTYALRFSDSQPAAVAVTFVDDGGEVSRTLVRARPRDQGRGPAFCISLSDRQHEEPTMTALLGALRVTRARLPLGVEDFSLTGW